MQEEYGKKGAKEENKRARGEMMMRVWYTGEKKGRKEKLRIYELLRKEYMETKIREREKREDNENRANQGLVKDYKVALRTASCGA